MNCYKKLSCDNYQEINQEILKHVTTVLDVDNTPSFWNSIPVVDFVQATPLLQIWLKAQQLQIKTLAVTVGTHKDCCGVHVDTPPAVYKLSWPIRNTETIWNRWFRELNNSCSVMINHLGGKQYLDRTQLQEIDRMRVDAPAIINAGIPHDVWFEEHSQFPRLGLQCQLLKEPANV
jgi:hypothetical protein